VVQKRIEVGIAGDLNGHQTTLGAGVDPMKKLQEAKAKVAVQIQQAESLHAKVRPMKELAPPDRHADLDKLLSKEATKQEDAVEELGKLKEGGVNVDEAMIKITKEAYPGVRIQIGSGELGIGDEYPSATFHLDQESNEVVGLFGGSK
jgi:hypothetical protein